MKLGQFQYFGVQVAHSANWLIGRTGTVTSKTKVLQHSLLHTGVYLNEADANKVE
jgi:hypothetical protein